MPHPLPKLPDGQRLYAIGDIHGCLDLLTTLMAKIDAECAKDGVTARKIFLGDYIDRGIKSSTTIQYCIDLKTREPNTVFLLGNHELSMRNLLLQYDEEDLANWLSYGGRETLLSYGISFRALTESPEQLHAEMVADVPAAHLEFLKSLKLWFVAGDYFFCHAGVRPGRPLTQQTERDLCWIRQDFLTSDLPFGKIVVHGHSISPEAEFKTNRIGIDTGAYASGCLTALGLEGQKQWLVQTR